jgi:hypothetical protein
VLGFLILEEKMSWKIYRLIYRLDFRAPCFALLDHFGRIAEEIKNYSLQHKSDLEDLGISFHPQMHSITIENSSQEESFKLHLEPNFSVLDARFSSGETFGGVSKTLSVKLSDYIHEKVIHSKFNILLENFSRIGLRTFSLKTTKNDFNVIKQNISKKLDFLPKFGDYDSDLNDLGIVCDIHHNNEIDKMRFSFGPYNGKDKKKNNFQLSGTAPTFDGIITDIDSYTTNETIKGFRYYKAFSAKLDTIRSPLFSGWEEKL